MLQHANKTAQANKLLAREPAHFFGLPNLESLTLRSGTMKIGKIDLPKLHELRVISGGFDPASLADICKAKWPRLETLDLQLGRDAKWTVKHLANLFAATAFPRLRYLGLGNATITDDICRAIVGTKIAAQLEVLDLTKGTMGDEGAGALAAGKFPKLHTLKVSENYLTRRGLAALKPSSRPWSRRSRVGGAIARTSARTAGSREPLHRGLRVVRWPNVAQRARQRPRPR